MYHILYVHTYLTFHTKCITYLLAHCEAIVMLPLRIREARIASDDARFASPLI
jgi:hypothetical protein